MKNNSILELFKEGFTAGYFKRIPSEPPLNLYVGKDNNNCYAFEFRGQFMPVRVNSSDLIIVTQSKNEEGYTICFSLENDELLERFSIFCQDLIDSVAAITDINEAYKSICNRYFSWKKLFKPSNGNLTEPEIMGLIGEILFLRDEMIPTYGEDIAIDSWSGPEKTHKDFSFNDTWVEVKAVSSGKDTVRISSIEQLDSNVPGSLVVYILEKMSANYNGLNLNKLVNEVLLSIHNQFQRDMFRTKLATYGYDGSSEYDKFVFSIEGQHCYLVGQDFPRLKRDVLSKAITKSIYEMSLSEIEIFKANTPWK